MTDTANVIVAAKLKILNAAAMSPARRLEIAKWLRNHADRIERDGDNYAPKFRGRYLYPEESK